jgi:hypothetical protein
VVLLLRLLLKQQAQVRTAETPIVSAVRGGGSALHTHMNVYSYMRTYTPGNEDHRTNCSNGGMHTSVGEHGRVVVVSQCACAVDGLVCAVCCRSTALGSLAPLLSTG